MKNVHIADISMYISKHSINATQIHHAPVHAGKRMNIWKLVFATD